MSDPRATPSAIAEKIQAVRYRSRNLSRLRVFIGLFDTSFVLSGWRCRLCDFVEFSLEHQVVESSERETKEQADPPVQQEESVSKGSFNFRFATTSCRGIRYAPVGR